MGGRKLSVCNVVVVVVVIAVVVVAVQVVVEVVVVSGQLATKSFQNLESIIECHLSLP